MKTIFKTIICSISVGVLVLLIAITTHIFFDKECSIQELHPTQTIVIADNTPIGTYNWVAVFSSIIALGISALTLYSQEKVADNTSMLSYKAQEQVLYDLVRHLYRNMVVMWAIVNRMNDAATRSDLRIKKTPPTTSNDKYTIYPSELHLIKAQVPIDNIHPELYVKNDTKYNKINSLLLKLRNYNTELSIAAYQLKDTNLTKDVKDYYIDALLLKPADLTNELIDILKSISSDKEVVKKCEDIISQSHSKNVKDNHGCTPWSGTVIKYENSDPYTKNLFANESSKFFDMLNKDAQIECGKNKSGGDKLLMIMF